MHSQINYRAIVRISLNKDGNSTVRNRVLKKLEGAGFINNKTTGAWETPSSPIITIQKYLAEAMEEIANLSADSSYATVLDHMWFYMDRVTEEGISSD